MGEPARRDLRSRGSITLGLVALIAWALGAMMFVWIRTSPSALGHGMGAALAGLYIVAVVGGSWLTALVASAWHALRYRTPAVPSFVVIGATLTIALGGALHEVRAAPIPLPALHEASGRGDAARVRELLAEGASIDELSSLRTTPCLHAVRACSLEVLRALAEAEPPVIGPGACWASVELVESAARCESPEVLRLLLDRDVGGPSERSSALGVAICQERTESVELLLARGIGGREALEAIARCGRWRSLERITGTDADHQYALRVASESGQTGSIHALLRAGTDPDASSLEDDERPLVLAVRAGSVDGARMLLDAGAAIDSARDTYSPLQTALESGDEALVRLLLERGARLEGRPTLHEEVREHGAGELARELLADSNGE